MCVIYYSNNCYNVVNTLYIYNIYILCMKLCCILYYQANQQAINHDSNKYFKIVRQRGSNSVAAAAALVPDAGRALERQPQSEK